MKEKQQEYDIKLLERSLEKNPENTKFISEDNENPYEAEED